MSDIKLYRTSTAGAVEIQGRAATVEKSLQMLIERDSETFLGVTFLSSEYSTGKKHLGRIDTLGIDENNCPVIIEYKRTTNENVINQGLFYLDWLLDHKAEFKLLVMEKLGKARAEDIDWSAPRLLCIAGDFNRYDEHAVQQINRNIDLLRYRHFGDDLLVLELVHRTSDITIEDGDGANTGKVSKTQKGGQDKEVGQAIADADPAIKDVYASLRAYLMSLGDDVQEKPLKLYMAYRKIKNFASVVVHKKSLVVYLKLEPHTVDLIDGFTRDVREIGHWGTGNLEVTLKSAADLKRAESLLSASYDAN